MIRVLHAMKLDYRYQNWRRIGTVGLCIFIVFIGVPIRLSSGQDTDNDPFGESSPSDSDFGSDDAFSASDQPTFGVDPMDDSLPSVPSPTTSTGESSDPLGRNLDPLIFILRENPPQTPSDYGRALDWMTQLGHWAEVAKLLDQIGKRNWQLPQQAELARTAGDKTWMILRRNLAQFSEPQREVVNALFQAPSKNARDPSNVDQWIAQLNDPDAVERRRAQVRLQTGGAASIERLLQRLIEGNSAVADLMLIGTVVEFGQPGIEAIQSALTLRNPDVTARILIAVAELPSNHFPIELASALHSQKTSLETKDALAIRLGKKGFRIPNASTTSTHLQKAFDAALADYQDRRLGPTTLQDIVWRVSDDGAAVSHALADRDMKSLERAYQIAQHKAALTTSTPDDWHCLLAVGLQRAYQLDPDSTNSQTVQLVLDDLPADAVTQPDLWSGAFGQANHWQMHGSCVKIIECLTVRIAAGKLSPPMDFLSELLNDSRPMIRFLAFKTVAVSDPKSDYAGSERALAVAVEMLQLGSGMTTLVIGANSELCMAAETAISQAVQGAVKVVSSGREALYVLSEPMPADLIVIVDRVHDLSLFELLQRLRKTQSGGSLPIAVMTDQLYEHERQIVEKMPGVVSGVLTRDAESMKEIVQQMLDSLDTQPISDGQRTDLQQVASDFLARISEDRSTYAFYPFDVWHQSLIELPSGTPYSSRTQVLASLGTRLSQLRLIQLVVALGAGEQERLGAAKAFENSIRRFGTLLTAQDVQTAYDLYNRLGPNDPIIAKVMTRVLDVIEAQAGTREWPSE